MAIVLKKIAGDPAGPAIQPQPATQAAPVGNPAPTMQPQPTPKITAVIGGAQASSAVKPPPNWMLQGKALNEAHAAEAAKAQMQQEMKGSAKRFWLPVNQEREIIFLDGDLDSDGMLKTMGYYEHKVTLGGNRENFVCLNGVPGMGMCPICEGGDKPSLVNLLTVLNITPYTYTKGPKAGQTITHSRMLFVMKKTTLSKLQFKASKIGGLTGKKFTVTRLDSGDGKSPNVGTEFEWNPIQLDDGSSLNQLTAEQLVAMFGDDGKPIDYEKEIPLLTADKLIALGAGKAPTGPGYEPKAAGATIDLSKLASQL